MAEPKIIARREPCNECPWRTDRVGKFGAEAYRRLATSAYDMSRTIFTCHISKEDAPVACAGFLLRGALHNLTIRMERCIVISQIHDGGHDLHVDYRAMAIANGVQSDDPALLPCRGNGYG